MSLRLDKSTSSLNWTRNPAKLNASPNSRLAKNHLQYGDYRYDPPWVLALTGLRVEVWRSKSSTGHDEKDDSLEANN